MKEEFDFESIKNKAIEQLKAGKSLLGKYGAFAPLLESILPPWKVRRVPILVQQSVKMVIAVMARCISMSKLPWRGDCFHSP